MSSKSEATSQSGSSNWKKGEARPRRGVPTQCECGSAITRWTSKTHNNPGRVFFRCANHEGNPSHLFKWVDDAFIEAIEDLHGEQQKQGAEIELIIKKMQEMEAEREEFDDKVRRNEREKQDLEAQVKQTEREKQELEANMEKTEREKKELEDKMGTIETEKKDLVLELQVSKLLVLVFVFISVCMYYYGLSV
ncbi:PREDICTED: uncharacterized protein At4g04775-like [Tarenaya hassleriana]|uniref:uncharacterized protein At4g04775-like n=1 Tax=Tarenaya hassleriana TaxID=28532 RepID=UPI00053C5801|nr:PREDICTED: uncharacterized protein At4g04775-like [Tarenaya hassleriana]